ncbi:sugar phosphate isomerase/epimerase family protein [Nioella aestuarii]|uniref:sugar phosphate isomerase/epimerase family protein n=1 Tax=Nioella aestuarii TaxID=1662864 RepID=UPI003D7F2CFB
MSRLLSVAHLTAITLDPPAFIEAAARVGFDGVGLRLIRVTPDGPGYPLMDDPVMMRATKAALASTGTRVWDIEFVRIMPETRPRDLCQFLDAGAELGAQHVITAPYDPNLGRLASTLAEIDELARERGLGTVLEFFPWTVVPDLKSAQKVVDAAGPTVGILPDALHFDRSESSFDDLRALPPHRIPFAHLCDAPVMKTYSEAELLHAARDERLAPGEGEIELSVYLDALPSNTPLSVEVPMTSLLKTAGADTVLARVFEASSAILQRQMTE